MRYEHAGDGPAPIMVADAVNFTKGRRTPLWRAILQRGGSMCFACGPVSRAILCFSVCFQMKNGSDWLSNG